MKKPPTYSWKSDHPNSEFKNLVGDVISYTHASRADKIVIHASLVTKADGQKICRALNACEGIPNPEETIPKLIDALRMAEGALACMLQHGHDGCAPVAKHVAKVLRKLPR